MNPTRTLPAAACVAAVLLASTGVSVAQQAPPMLAPPSERITDGAIQHDHRIYESLQARIRSLNGAGRPVADPHLAKAQCWLDASFHEYSRNDRSAFPQAALDESTKLVVAIEQGMQSLPDDTPLVGGTDRLRPDLWHRLLAVRSKAGAACALARAACAEVQLVHAGHELREQGWRHAKPYVQMAEDATSDAEALAASCAGRR